MKRDEFFDRFGITDTTEHMVRHGIGATIGTAIVYPLIYFAGLVDSMPTWYTVVGATGCYVGTILCIYSNRPNRPPGSWL